MNTNHPLRTYRVRTYYTYCKYWHTRYTLLRPFHFSGSINTIKCFTFKCFDVVTYNKYQIYRYPAWYIRSNKYETFWRKLRGERRILDSRSPLNKKTELFTLFVFSINDRSQHKNRELNVKYKKSFLL